MNPKSTINLRFIHFIFTSLLSLFVIFTIPKFIHLSSPLFTFPKTDYRRRPECTCARLPLAASASFITFEQRDNNQSILCSQYASHRGPHQHVISISLFGPKENKLFHFNQTIHFLDELIKDINMQYSDGFILRVHHDNTINATNLICPIECKHPNVDFCNMSHKLYIPPKIWRFVPAGDPMVDIGKLFLIIVSFDLFLRLN